MTCDFSCVFSQYAEGVILNLEAMWEESDVRTPMICFLSMGSDPTASIEALAKKQRLGKHSCHILLTLSLPECLIEFCKVTLTFESVDEIL